MLSFYRGSMSSYSKIAFCGIDFVINESLKFLSWIFLYLLFIFYKLIISSYFGFMLDVYFLFWWRVLGIVHIKYQIIYPLFLLYIFLGCASHIQTNVQEGSIETLHGCCWQHACPNGISWLIRFFPMLKEPVASHLRCFKINYFFLV